jgi:hypothetical protein
MNESDFWEFEDYLDSKNVYINGIDGRTAHMDSYMTITDYNKLIPALQEIKERYTHNQWIEFHKYFNYMSYLSPNAGILASVIERLFIK